jgi:drug/metabolite transporter (DMT)-like permease
VNPNLPVTDPDAHDAGVRGPEEGKNRAMLIGLILLSVGLAALAQLTLKHGMNQVTADRGGVAALDASSLKAVVTNLFVIGGLAIFGISAVVWLLVLSRASLSFAYPFASLSYLLIVLAARFVLHEQIPPLRWVGVACIMTGIILVAQTPHN